MSIPIFPLLLAFRIINALSIRTFFQPDEFIQALEPALKLAFGEEIHPSITWEWEYQLRSSLHPLLFALTYRVAESLATWFHVSTATRSQLLLAAPKILQAVFAASMDYYTLRLAQRAYGCQGRVAWIALALSVFSPWQFFCSVRTFSNSLETTLTVAALSFWPWTQMLPSTPSTSTQSRDEKSKVSGSSSKSTSPGAGLRIALLLAAIAVVLRPTNLLIWLPLGLYLFLQSPSQSRQRLISEAAFTGLTVIALSALADRWFYGKWTIPALQFIHININKNIAVFYGRNRLDYYFTEGIGQLLTTALPFALYGIYQNLTQSTRNPSNPPTPSTIIPTSLTWTTLIVLTTLSTISHKEVRFIYPLLPPLHLIASLPLYTFLSTHRKLSRILLPLLLVTNIALALYTTQIHQRGVLDLTHHLRHTHEARLSTNPSAKTTVGILMPCHSTPWRSHLIHPGIHIWALTCEPPIDVPLTDRASYLDEADQFYADPARWLARHMGSLDGFAGGRTSIGRSWPSKLVFFEHLEETMREVLGGTEYRECWRGFNSHWHDDRRRTGDVIIWCRDG